MLPHGHSLKYVIRFAEFPKRFGALDDVAVLQITVAVHKVDIVLIVSAVASYQITIACRLSNVVVTIAGASIVQCIAVALANVVSGRVSLFR